MALNLILTHCYERKQQDLLAFLSTLAFVNCWKTQISKTTNWR